MSEKDKNKDEQYEKYEHDDDTDNKDYTPTKVRDGFQIEDEKYSNEVRELDMSIKADLPHGVMRQGATDMKRLPKSKPGWRILFEEVISDKLALFSLIILVIITAYVFGLTMFLNQSEIVKVDLFSINQPPNDTFRLGTDYGGRDIFGQLIIVS